MLRTTLLLSVPAGISMLLGQWPGGAQGLVVAFIFAVVLNFSRYWFSDKIELKDRIVRLQEIAGRRL